MGKRILVVGDYELVHQGIRHVLRRGYTICGEASTGEEAFVKAVALKPDLVIVNLTLTMPVLNGLDAARKIRKAAPSTKILLLSMRDPAQLQKDAQDVGADAFVAENATADDLLNIVRRLIGTTKEDEADASLDDQGFDSRSRLAS